MLVPRGPSRFENSRHRPLYVKRPLNVHVASTSQVPCESLLFFDRKESIYVGTYVRPINCTNCAGVVILGFGSILSEHVHNVPAV